jgi:hypothetical protein
MYEPLKTRRSFRLLEVKPGPNLSYELFTTSIDTARDSYNALSYTWGAPGEEKTVIMNGHPFQVQKSLFQFLTQLNKMCWTGFLWVDAMCIDQSDIPERNQQVSIMHKIYAAAKEVVVWLGLGTPQSDYLFDVSAHSRGLGCPSNISNEVLDGVIDILRRNYWTRMWIVQELAQASNTSLMCGEKILRWEQIKWLTGENAEDRDELLTPKFQKLFETQGASGSRTQGDLDQWIFTAEFFWTYGRNHVRHGSLSHLIYAFGHMECKDKHDRIYALLGLVDTDNELNRRRYFDVDYSSSVVDLFTKTLTALDRNEENPDLQMALDLTVFLELNQKCSVTERNRPVVVHLPFIGTVGSELDKGFDKILTQAETASTGLESSKIDGWVHNDQLVACYPSENEIAILDSQHLHAQDRLYTIHISLACLRLNVRPAHSLVALTSYDESNNPVLKTGLYFYPALGRQIFKGKRSNLAILLLLQWRRIFEDHLRTAHLESSSNGEILTITITVDACIKLSQALLQVTQEWQ